MTMKSSISQVHQIYESSQLMYSRNTGHTSIKEQPSALRTMPPPRKIGCCTLIAISFLLSVGVLWSANGVLLLERSMALREYSTSIDQEIKTLASAHLDISSSGTRRIDGRGTGQSSTHGTAMLDLTTQIFWIYGLREIGEPSDSRSTIRESLERNGSVVTIKN